jgi:major membrane immunogen (membrane-anchored lipoprotein)
MGDVVMAVLSLLEMPKLKELVSQYGYVIHVHDSCGGQSFTLESVNDGPNKQVYKEIEDFFLKHQMTVKFYDHEKLNFIAI